MKQIQKKCLTGLESKFAVILGSQWGDEGKGKLVDILADKYDYCCRFNGGNNAGHTIVAGNKKYAFHLLPSGMLYDQTKNILGNGVVVNLPAIFEELEQLQGIDYSNRLFISDRAHLVTNVQMEIDGRNELDPTQQTIGTTRKGIGPTYAAKMNRYGLRVGDLADWDVFTEKYNYMWRVINAQTKLQTDPVAELKDLKQYRDKVIANKMIVDTIPLLHNAIKRGDRILGEGANAAMLDIDFGTYPFVTSSPTTIGGVVTGLGVPPGAIETAIGIVKAYTTRVGEGPFPTEQLNNIGEFLQNVGHEYGVTTGRKRRCGWLDIPLLRYGNMINNYTSFNLTKLDVLSDLDEIKIGVDYVLNGQKIDYMPSTLLEYSQVEVDYISMKGWKKDISGITDYNALPQEAKAYIKKIEELLNVPITWVGTGPERESIALQE